MIDSTMLARLMVQTGFAQNMPVPMQEMMKLATAIFEAGMAEEREACAKVCEATMEDVILGGNKEYNTGRQMGATVCANRIRMRSNAALSGRPLVADPLEGTVMQQEE